MPGRALVVVPQPAGAPGWFAGLGRSHGAVAAGVAIVMGAGFVAGTQAFASKPHPVAAVASADTAADVLRHVQDEVRSLRAGRDGLRAGVEDGRQVDAIRGLKRSVEALRQDIDGVKAASAGAAQPDARVAQLASRLDRLEREVASPDVTGSLPAGAAPAAPKPVPLPVPPQRPAAPVPVAVLPAGRPDPAKPDAAKPELAKAEVAKPEASKPEVSKPEPPRPEVARAEIPRPEVARAEAAPRLEAPARPAVVQGWLLRDVYGGVALVEGPAGGLREVAPGEVVPGAGAVRSIERRGRNWVVVTSRGVIQADSRW